MSANVSFCEGVQRAVGAEQLPSCDEGSAGGSVLPISLSGLSAVLEEAKGANSTVHTLALFHGARCPFSRALEPTYVALAEKFPTLFAFAVEGSDGGRLTSRLGVRSFPTLVLLKGDAVQRVLYQRRLPDLITRVANATALSPLGAAPAAEGAAAAAACVDAAAAGAGEGDDMQQFTAFMDSLSNRPEHPIRAHFGRMLGFVNESYLDPPADIFGSDSPEPVDWVLVLAASFLAVVGVVLASQRLAASPKDATQPQEQRPPEERGCCSGMLVRAAGRIAALSSILDSPPPPNAGPIAAGTKLRVSYGDGFEGRGANWAVRIRSKPTLNNREGRVLGHVRNGETLTATGRTEREFVHVQFQQDKVGWMAMHWEGYTMLSVVPEPDPEPEPESEPEPVVEPDED
jgi:hypothetical protein